MATLEMREKKRTKIKTCTYKNTNISSATCFSVSNLVPDQFLDIMGRLHDKSLFKSRLRLNTALASLQFKSGLLNKSLACG